MASCKEAAANHEWFVSIPFSDLEKLLHEEKLLEEMKKENAQLRREMDGLRNLFTELQIAFGDLRRGINGK